MNLFNKFYGLILVALFLPCILVSCRQEGKGMKHPKPSENPVYLTAEAQTKDITVKNLALIYPEKETDKLEIDGEKGIMTLETDWFTITTIHEREGEKMTFEVKANTSNESRTYNLEMSGKPGKTILHIIQSGKTGN